MEIGRKLTRSLIAAAAVVIVWSLCQPSSGAAFAQGARRHIPAYYDGELFTINVFELVPSETLLEKNRSINEIFVKNDLDEEQEFTPVIDAIQGDGFNPLWHQIFIEFNPGFAPHQFFSDEEIEDAASGPNPEITLVPSDEVYICAVVGRKKG